MILRSGRSTLSKPCLIPVPISHGRGMTGAPMMHACAPGEKVRGSFTLIYLQKSPDTVLGWVTATTIDHLVESFSSEFCRAPRLPQILGLGTMPSAKNVFRLPDSHVGSSGFSLALCLPGVRERTSHSHPWTRLRTVLILEVTYLRLGLGLGLGLGLAFCQPTPVASLRLYSSIPITHVCLCRSHKTTFST